MKFLVNYFALDDLVREMVFESSPRLILNRLLKVTKRRPFFLKQRDDAVDNVDIIFADEEMRIELAYKNHIYVYSSNVADMARLFPTSVTLVNHGLDSEIIATRLDSCLKHISRYNLLEAVAVGVSFSRADFFRFFVPGLRCICIQNCTVTPPVQFSEISHLFADAVDIEINVSGMTLHTADILALAAMKSQVPTTYEVHLYNVDINIDLEAIHALYRDGCGPDSDFYVNFNGPVSEAMASQLLALFKQDSYKDRRSVVFFVGTGDSYVHHDVSVNFETESNAF